jgi:UDP:flavonoid glycosyltransferase YjiC (YdhE family)
MRFLCTFAGGQGHLEPLIPIAYALRAAGHAVAMVGRPWMAPQVRTHGFEWFAAGSDAGLAPVTRPLAPVDMDREFQDLRDGFVRRLGDERATAMIDVIAGWRPDLVLWEETDVGGAVAAERAGLPHAMLTVTAAGSFVHRGTVGAALDELRARHTLPPDGPGPTGGMLDRFLVLSPFPVSFRDPAVPVPVQAHGVRLFDPDAFRSPGPAPAWATVVPDAPVLHLSLGTVFNHESGDLFHRALRALAALRVNALVTVGREIDPTIFGPQPGHVTIERFVPQREVLPHVDLVVSHGGSGSVLGALAHGRPMVLLPMGADQPLNAARCEAVGVGRSLDVLLVTPETIAATIRDVLDDPAYRAAAAAIAEEIVALPPPAEVVPVLERLARSRRPLRA